MEVDAAVCDVKEVCKRGSLASICVISCLLLVPLLVLVTSKTHDDIVLLRGRQSLFHCSGCTLQTTGKPAADSFMDLCEGSLQAKAS